MEDLSVPACASEPGGDGGLLITEDPFGSGSVQSFGEGSQHHGDLLGRGFQTIQGGVASGSECGVAGRASKGLDPLGLAMLAIADQGVDMSICDPGIRALLVGTGEALGVYPDGVLPGGFSPHARDAQTKVLALQPTREWRRDDRWGNRVGSGA